MARYAPRWQCPNSPASFYGAGNSGDWPWIRPVTANSYSVYIQSRQKKFEQLEGNWAIFGRSDRACSRTESRWTCSVAFLDCLYPCAYIPLPRTKPQRLTFPSLLFYLPELGTRKNLLENGRLMAITWPSKTAYPPSCRVFVLERSSDGTRPVLVLKPRVSSKTHAGFSPRFGSPHRVLSRLCSKNQLPVFPFF